MKRMLCLLMAVLLLSVQPALAASLLEITTDASVTGITLLDEKGVSVGTVVRNTPVNNTKVWQVEIPSSASGQATLFVKGSTGGWQCTYTVYSLNGSRSGSTSSSQAGNTSASASAPAANPWPEREYEGKRTGVYELPRDKRYQSRCGPSRSYHGGGAYKTYKISSIKALFIEDGYVYADLDYTSVGRRRLYFSEDIFTSLSGVPDVSLSGYSAKTTEKVTPRFGPGSKYDEFVEAKISAGTSLEVFFEEDGWVFAEFDCGLGSVRAWIRESQVKAR